MSRRYFLKKYKILTERISNSSKQNKRPSFTARMQLERLIRNYG